MTRAPIYVKSMPILVHYSSGVFYIHFGNYQHLHRGGSMMLHDVHLKRDSILPVIQWYAWRIMYGESFVDLAKLQTQNTSSSSWHITIIRHKHNYEGGFKTKMTKHVVESMTERAPALSSQQALSLSATISQVQALSSLSILAHDWWIQGHSLLHCRSREEIHLHPYFLHRLQASRHL